LIKVIGNAVNVGYKYAYIFRIRVVLNFCRKKPTKPNFFKGGTTGDAFGKIKVRFPKFLGQHLRDISSYI